METLNEVRQGMSRIETARFLGVCVGTLKKLDIPCAKVGRRLVYFRDDVIQWATKQVKLQDHKGKKRRQKPKADADAGNNAENPKPEADATKAKQAESKNGNAGNELFEGAENAKSKS